MQWFTSETSRVQKGVAGTQQTEIQALRSEIEHLRVPQELSMRTMETASTSSSAELRTTVAGLQQEVSVERAQRECEEQLNKEVINCGRKSKELQKKKQRNCKVPCKQK